jgi:hypothetical protein
MQRSDFPLTLTLSPRGEGGHSSPQQSWGVFWHVFIKFPWLTFCSPLRAREAPPRLPRLNGVGGELHIKAGGVPVQMEVGLI